MDSFLELKIENEILTKKLNELKSIKNKNFTSFINPLKNETLIKRRVKIIFL